MSPEFVILFVGPASFVAGVVCGMALYRVLWHVDTATIRQKLTDTESYNKNLQAQVHELRTEMDTMRQRIRILEETNNELMVRDRSRGRQRG